MKIAMIAGYYPPDIRGGGEISGKLLADILSSAGATVHVLTCGQPAREEVVDSVAVRRITSPNVYWNYNTNQPKIKKLEWYIRENINPRSRNAVRAFIDEIQPDIVVTSTIENFGAEAWVAPHQAGVPSVHILRSYYPFCWQGSAVKDATNCSGNCIDCKMLTFGRRKASRYVNGVIGISNYILQRHQDEKLFQNAQSTVIPEPISQEHFLTSAKTTCKARFGYLGVLSPDKGLRTLADAWSAIHAPQASLSIAGKGTPAYQNELAGAFPADVRFTGWVDSDTYLAEIDFLIVPSLWHEPFGRIVIEAFAKGIPVIGSRTGGIAENIKDGKNGFLFSPGDQQELAALIRRCAAMTDEEYRLLSNRALIDVQAYESKTIAQAHLNFYQRIIDSPKKTCTSAAFHELDK